MNNANATAIAGGAVSLALIQVLIRKDILTRDDARSILNAAQSRVAAYASSSGIDDAHNALTVLRSLAGEFS